LHATKWQHDYGPGTRGPRLLGLDNQHD
jgi:hypothetical protein